MKHSNNDSLKRSMNYWQINPNNKKDRYKFNLYTHDIIQSASYKLGYNKDMICIGDEESSFEELRAKLPKYCYMPPNIHTLRTVTAPQIAVQTDDMDASDDDLDLPLTNQFLLSPLPPQLHARQVGIHNFALTHTDFASSNNRKLVYHLVKAEHLHPLLFIPSLPMKTLVPCF